MIELNPAAASRRSAVYREFAHAEFRRVAGQPQPWSSPGAMGEGALYDFSLMPRFGVRGAGAADFLKERQLGAPTAVNTAVSSDDQRWVARLGKTEYWVLAPTAKEDYPSDMSGVTAPADGCYPVPCNEGRAWFVLFHPRKTEVMAKLCGVDLREAVFPLGSIAQTSVARGNAVIIHHMVFGKPVFSVFSDVSSSSYLWGALVDALEEFDVGPGTLDDIIQAPRSRSQ